MSITAAPPWSREPLQETCLTIPFPSDRFDVCRRALRTGRTITSTRCLASPFPADPAAGRAAGQGGAVIAIGAGLRRALRRDPGRAPRSSPVRRCRPPARPGRARPRCSRHPSTPSSSARGLRGRSWARCLDHVRNETEVRTDRPFRITPGITAVPDCLVIRKAPPQGRAGNAVGQRERHLREEAGMPADAIRLLHAEDASMPASVPAAGTANGSRPLVGSPETVSPRRHPWAPGSAAGSAGWTSGSHAIIEAWNATILTRLAETGTGAAGGGHRARPARCDVNLSFPDRVSRFERRLLGHTMPARKETGRP